MRLIDADVLIEQIEQEIMRNEEWESFYIVGLEKAKTFIENASTIKTEPVRLPNDNGVNKGAFSKVDFICAILLILITLAVFFGVLDSITAIGGLWVVLIIQNGFLFAAHDGTEEKSND